MSYNYFIFICNCRKHTKLNFKIRYLENYDFWQLFFLEKVVACTMSSRTPCISYVN